jgi:DedD protein
VKDVAAARAAETPASSAPSKSGEAPTAADRTPKPPTGDARASSAKGSYSVQLAAFSDDKGANALAGRLKKAGHPAYTEPYNTSRGTLYRVRVGPYPTRDAAEAARAKLKADGQNGIIATAN